MLEGLMKMQCQKCASQGSCIEHVPIFSSLSRDERLEIIEIAASRSFDKGENIYSTGDLGGKLFVLHTGKVKVYRLNPNGKEQVLRVIEPGEFIGELSLFSSLPLTDNAQALEATTMCVLQGQRIKELMAKYPSIAIKVMDELSRRLENAENMIETISLSSVTKRVAQALLELSADQEDIILPMTKSKVDCFAGSGLYRIKRTTSNSNKK
jgi:CRP/FNR family transcriptional regulator